LQNLEYHERVTAIIELFEKLVEDMILHRLCMFWYTLVITLRFFKGFRGQPRIAVISQTLKEASVDLFHFLMIFLVVFVNFALGGYVLFGAQLKNWSTIFMAMNSCFSMMFGDVDYQSFHHVAPATAAIWFWSYVIVMILVMLNLLISIIMEHYMTVKDWVGESGMSILEQTAMFWRDLRWKYSRKGSRKTVPIQDLLTLVSTNPLHQRAKATQEKTFHRMPRTEEERQELYREETHFVSSEFLAEHGCDARLARRLLEKCGSQIENLRDINPTETLGKLMAVEMKNLQHRCDRMEDNLDRFASGTFQEVSRIGQKQRKFTKFTQKMVQQNWKSAWTIQEDEDGQKYYYNEVTGDSSWTPPSNDEMFGPSASAFSVMESVDSQASM